MKLLIDELNESERIDNYLTNVSKDLSRSKIQSKIKNGEQVILMEETIWLKRTKNREK